MMKYKKPVFIAEICCNHMGCLELALEMIKLAKQAGVDGVKFQKRNIDLWSDHKKDVYSKPHPSLNNSFGKTYEEHRRKLELSLKEHKVLREECKNMDLLYGVSVFDIISAKEMVEINPDFIKIPSACNNNYELIEWLCNNYYGDIHISLGMTIRNDIDKIMNVFKKNNRLKDLYVYICTSAYPVDYKNIYLLEIEKLCKKYGDFVKGIGFSGHHVGIIPDVVAYTLGATIFERHFTINKELKGTDQKFALTCDEYKCMIENINNTRKTLKYKPDNRILRIEEKNEVKLKW